MEKCNQFDKIVKDIKKKLPLNEGEKIEIEAYEYDYQGSIYDIEEAFMSLKSELGNGIYYFEWQNSAVSFYRHDDIMSCYNKSFVKEIIQEGYGDGWSVFLKTNKTKKEVREILEKEINIKESDMGGNYFYKHPKEKNIKNYVDRAMAVLYNR